MAYEFSIMTQVQAEEIAFNWNYKGVYSFYDIQADEEDFLEFVDSEKRGESVFVVENENELIGYLSLDKTSALTIDIGLGMRPDLTGKGKGLAFLEAVLAFVKDSYQPVKITLAVATFNQRAVKVYKKAGFKEKETFMQNTNGSTYEFVKMELQI
ncbi:GNAT family N-acetyltransferase [Virgibacillus sp. DJP39]|uniref:GNAT family N-acetyltransferase n=1 Tax=Virgibacillus sp. DJP39 TaxID=3409790 RepID=UPI003BB48DB3